MQDNEDKMQEKDTTMIVMGVIIGILLLGCIAAGIILYLRNQRIKAP